ncbi:5-methylcytosine restriction system specificity protein McrC [Symbiobacterium terraclitae]|uniref:5-methylcytosine restriction system specificity protein McrC n=1 Tax=Symbiobacterium terraclitae TaxID=557451 RepID=UPI0035B52DC0
MAAGRSRVTAPRQTPLFRAVDNGPAIALSPQLFAPPQRDGGWGSYADSFLRVNQAAFEALDVKAEAYAGTAGLSIRITPGGKTGAVPLRSAQTGRVVGGLLVSPRFGWAGVGRVLAETGWPALPEFLALPMVPGSGREVPPWVLAGPVLARLEAMLQRMKRGYQQRDEVLGSPRGRILWNPYISSSLVRGQWHRVPCRFPDLGHDPQLRRYVRWVLERVHDDLVRVGRGDRVAVGLADVALRLLHSLSDVQPQRPRRHELDQLHMRGLKDEALCLGIEAMAWVEEERGLGGGQEMDGLAWAMSLDKLWEAYVEGVVRREAKLIGGEVRVGRLGETTVPIAWQDPVRRSLGYLVPDIVVRRGRTIHVIDAKYKAHFADLDEVGWRRFTEEAKAAHRADVHQILAYAALYNGDDIAATLVFPLGHRIWARLAATYCDRVSAELVQGGRRIKLQMVGLPFGCAYDQGKVLTP